ncbi:PAS domain-containing hybrid sensor histidine kinase/response regulator [Lewinella sp. IMCC34191]|uniref:PAS domain-containing hybrid sensor histidine kinase/response regulator n=1 Tax=Lewinella sp. IMCC34191 TaxID=2259172 RepID=UPI000E24952B|nr:PAS domain-containing hybrid sensor histidine kinase/response regulator [Lewinella sp. IMCC34191]
MAYHKTLNRQIKKHLSQEVLDLPEVQSLLKSVHESYSAHDRDRETMNHAYQVTQVEMEEVNRELNSLVDQRQRSLKELNRAAAELIEGESNEVKQGDLVSLAENIRGRVHVSTIVKDELNRNINLFKALLNNLKSAVLIENEHSEVLFANELFCEYFSQAFRPDDLIGADAGHARKQAKSLFKAPETFMSGIEKVLHFRQPVYNERLDMDDGRVLERDYVPIFVNGEYRGHLWKFNDVTEKTRYEERLRESEERNRLVMDSSQDAIIISNEEGKIEGWNPRAEELFGWSYEEVRGLDGAEIILPAHLREAQIGAITEHLMPGPDGAKSRVIEMSAVNRKGEEFPIELVAVTYQQNGENFYASFIKDISVRKRSEKRLKAQEEKYRNIIADMNLGLLTIDLDGTILYANQSFCNMSGYTMEELVGNHTTLFQYKEEDLAIVQEKMKLSTRGISDTFEITAKNKAGEKRWWFVSGGPSYNDDGKQIGCIALHLDITDQKRMEVELEIAKNKAEQASVAKEAFLANMSHEIRTPLNAIIGMIRELGREELSPKQQNYLSHTDSAARHLLSIVNSILDISKIEAGELELDEEDFSLEALVANIRSILHIKAAQKGLAFDCQLSNNIWPAHLGDSARIRQVLINLLGNAIKFTMEGTVSLCAEVVKEDDQEQLLRIEIADTGIGMDEKFLAEIFSKFSQADRSIARRFGGTGLGMSITKEFIRLMGGTIEVFSEKDKGTQFVIHVALPKGNSDKLARHESHNQQLLHGTHILLVEDNIMNRFIAKKSLSHFGCKIDEAENGRIALDMLRENTYDLVLMDIQMPELDGVATTKIIRGELHLDVPIIAVTANAFRKDIDLYLSIGMNDYVTKPFEEHALFDTLAHQLRDRIQTENTTVDYTGGSYDLTDLHKLSRGDDAFVRKMIEIFVEQTPAALHEIREALGQRDYLTISKVAHRIKPSISSMGVGQLDGVAKDLEDYAKSSQVDVDELTNKIAFFSSTLTTVVEKLRENELSAV